MIPRRDAEVLADPTRFRLLAELRGSARARTVAELTDAVGVHHTSVRRHLARLRDAGLVEEATEPPRGRGRPRLVYTAVPDDADPTDGYRMLASLLARAVRSGRAPEDEGRAAGRSIADAMAPVADRDVVEVLEDTAARLGFRPRLETTADRPDEVDLVLRACPFADVAAEDPATVCSLHLGLARGLTAGLGGVEVTDLSVADPHVAGCRLHLRRVDGGNGDTGDES